MANGSGKRTTTCRLACGFGADEHLRGAAGPSDEPAEADHNLLGFAETTE
jgi:hypothetical protein